MAKTTDRSNIKLSLTASRVGAYFYNECNRNLVYESVGKNTRKQLGWADLKNQNTSAAIAGNAWEEHVLIKLVAESANSDVCVLYKKGDDEDTYEKFSFDQTVEIMSHIDELDQVSFLKNCGMDIIPDKRYKSIYIYQSCVCATDTFKNQYNFNNLKNIGFSDEMYPDFIRADYDEVSDKYFITVIDVKLANHLKTNAQIQIALYAQMLKAILAENNIEKCVVNEIEGIVWNKEEITYELIPNSFTLKEAYVEIDKFFSEDGPLYDIQKCMDYYISSNVADDAAGIELLASLKCSVAPGCAYCDNREKCFAMLKEKRSVRLLPYLSALAQKKLDEKLDSKEIENDSIDAVRKYLEGDQYKNLTEDCTSWKNIKNDIDKYGDAYEEYLTSQAGEARYPKNASSITFPKWQDFALVLTAQKDDNTGRNYAYAWYLDPKKGLDIFNPQDADYDKFVNISTAKDLKKQKGKGTYYGAIVAKNNTAEEFDRIDRAFVEQLYNIFKKIDEFSLEEGEEYSLQIYVMDAYEKQNIENALFNMLDYLDEDIQEDRQTIQKLISILYWMQGENSITDMDTHPREVVDTPVTVITLEINKLYVLPEAVLYDLRAVSKHFSPNYNFSEDTSSYFTDMNNTVNGMKILGVWEKNESTENIEWHLIRRVDIEHTIIQRIQLDARDNLLTLPYSADDFSLDRVSPRTTSNPDLSKLIFETKYEALLQYRQIMNARTKGISNAIEEGNVLLLEGVSELVVNDGNEEANRATLKLLNKDSYGGKSWFQGWICEDTLENRSNILKLRDEKYKINWRLDALDLDGTKINTTKVGKDIFVTDDGVDAYLTVYIKRPNRYGNPEDAFTLQAGHRYLLFERFTDFNTPKVLDGLDKIVASPRLEKLLKPEELSVDTEIKRDIDNAMKSCEPLWQIGGMEFSPSQKEAFKHVLSRKLTILQGPPASGKTDFIARTIITLCRYYKQVHDKNLHVLVSAQSHAAMDNILIKLSKMKAAGDINDIDLYKHERFANQEIQGVTITSRYGGVSLEPVFDERNISVIGMTCYNVQKEDLCGRGCFDLIIIDEASQHRTMDACLQLETAKEDARILLVGDLDQLPPIILGNYKRKENKKYIYGSIFETYISSLVEQGNTEDIISLKDNFRMNEILSRYSAKKIYGSEYKAFNVPIATQKMSLQNSSGDELLDYILDPQYPLVFCKLTGAVVNQKTAELELVTSLVSELWDNLLNKDGSTLASNRGNFWDEIDGLDGGCGLISPHHAHINRLRGSISAKLGCDPRDVYVDTVEKLQGKERTAVIVSYGVYDRETIENESEFIFSRNRFNVSLTRGKAKTIVFLSDIVADSSITTNNIKNQSKTLGDGIAYLQDFEEFMLTADHDEDIASQEFTYGDVILKIMKKRCI